MGGPIKLDTLLNENIDLEELQKYAQGRFKKNEKVQERLKQALKDQQQCQNTIESIEDNALTTQDLESVLEFVDPLVERKVQYEQLTKLSSLSTIPSLFQKIANGLNLKGLKTKNIEQVSEAIFEKTLAPSFKPTKKLIKILKDKQPVIMDKQLQELYSLILEDEFKKEEEIQQEQEEIVEEEQELEVIEVEEVQEIVEKQTTKKQTKQQQSKQVQQKRTTRRQQKQEEVQQQQQQDEQEEEQEVQEIPMPNEEPQQIEQEEQQQQLQQEEEGEQEYQIDQEIVEEKQVEQQLEEGEIMEVEQIEVMEIEQQQQQEVQEQEEEVQEQKKELELPEDLTQQPNIDVENFKIFKEMLEKKVKSTKQKKKKSQFQHQLQIANLSLELALYFSENNDQKHTKSKINEFSQQIQKLGLNLGWMQCLVIQDLEKDIQQTIDKISSLFEQLNKSYDVQADEPIHLTFLNSPKLDLNEVEEMISSFQIQFQKFDFTEIEELSEQVAFIDKSVLSAKMISQNIVNFFREINLNSMQGEDYKVVENRIIEIVEQINTCPIQVKKDQTQLTYKSWLFSCICFQKKFKTGDAYDWKELKECGEMFKEEADQRFIKLIQQQLDFQEQITMFMSQIQEKSINQVKDMIELAEKYLLQSQDIAQLKENIAQIQERQDQYKDKLMERLTVKEWRDILNDLQDNILINYKETIIVQQFIENIEKFDLELQTLKKEKKKDIIQQQLQVYLQQNFKHPEYEKLIKKHKVKESDITLLKRKIVFEAISYEELKQLEEQYKEDMENQDLLEQILKRKMDILFDSQECLLTFKEVKELLEINKEKQEIKDKLEQVIQAIEYELLIIEHPSKQCGEKDQEFKYLNKKFVDYKQELQEQEKKRQEYEEFLKKQQEEDQKKTQLEDRPYELESFSTKKVSDKAMKYKNTFITRLSKYIEGNSNWKINTELSVNYAKKIVNRIYSHFQNSDRVLSIGDRVISSFKLLNNYPKISQQLFSDNFPLIQVLALKDKSQEELQAKEHNRPVQHQHTKPSMKKKKIKINDGSEKVVKQQEQRQQSNTLANKAKSKASVLKQPPASFFNKSREGSIEQPKQQKRDISIEERYIDIIDKKSVQKQQLQKKRAFPKLSEDIKGGFSTDEDLNNSITLEQSFENERIVSNNTCDGRILRMFNGPMDNDTNQLQKISFMSTNNFSSLSQLPQRAQKGFLSIKDTCKFQKFRDYFDLILKDTSKNRTLINFGWLESELFNHNEALKSWGYKLRSSQRTAIIQWANECKLYILHKDNLTPKWKAQLKYSEDNFCFNECNLIFISIYKKYKAIATPKLIPEVIPEDQHMYKQQQQQKQEMLQKQIMESEQLAQENQQQQQQESTANDTYNSYTNRTQYQQNYSKQSMNKFRNNNHNNQNNNNNNRYNGNRSVAKFSTRKQSMKKSMSKQQYHNHNNNNNNNRNNFMNMNNNNNNNFNFNNNNMNSKENYLVNKYSTMKQNNNNNNNRKMSMKKFNNNNNRNNNNRRNGVVNQYVRMQQGEMQQEQEKNQIGQVLDNIQQTLGQLTTQKQLMQQNQQQQQQQQFQQPRQSIKSFANSDLMDTVRKQQEQIEQLKRQNEMLNSNNNNNYGKFTANKKKFNKNNNKKNSRSQFFGLQDNHASLANTDCEDSFDNTSMSHYPTNNMNSQQQQNGFLSQNSYASNINTQQQQQQQPQMKTENMFLRTAQQPPARAPQQQKNTFSGLSDITSQFSNKENMNYDQQNEIPAYLKQKLSTSFNFNVNNPQRAQSNFSYSTNNSSKDFQTQRQDNRFMAF